MPNIFLNELPHSPEGAKLILTKEQEENCRVVYQIDGKGGATFSALWNPAADYSDEYVIVPLRSSYKGVSKEYAAGTCFANVDGSSRDKLTPSQSWISLLREKLTEYPTDSCCAENNLYDPDDGSTIERKVYYRVNVGDPTDIYAKFACSRSMVGGHVLMESTHSTSVVEGADVMLLPICNCHNIAHPSFSDHWGTGFYMKLQRKMQAVILKNYIRVVTDEE